MLSALGVRLLLEETGSTHTITNTKCKVSEVVQILHRPAEARGADPVREPSLFLLRPRRPRVSVKLPVGGSAPNVAQDRQHRQLVNALSVF